ncbi:MAG: ketoacyl-ACP synthase III [Eggerthellaceae bacterium]|jgi:3-oxoacyl-[acyl-carrier-protein] synthase-3|nr:ketoacyl-ACP synthase III [Eggerthellaceae bacterium]MCH4221518.1 ketoacyl-ACP synthase III [Eggerthellaceae bacterium]
MNSIEIVSMGRCVPQRILTNDDLSKMVDTNDEWIVTRTGIHQRHIVDEGMTNADIATQAARDALDRASVDPNTLAAIIVATFTPDMFVPTVSATVHDRLGLNPATLALDLNGACCGFIYAMRTAQGLLALNPDKPILVVASEAVSSVLDFTDRSTCVLFGDGAAAAVVRSSDTPSWFVAGTRGRTDAISCPAHYAGDKPGIGMKGQEVFRFACTSIERSIRDLLKQSGLALGDIEHVVCHQANGRIISHVIKHLGADPAQFFMDVGEYGNTSAASIPLALADMDYQGLLHRGDRVLMTGFGAGLCEGGMLLTW